MSLKDNDLEMKLYDFRLNEEIQQRSEIVELGAKMENFRVKLKVFGWESP